MGGEGAADEGPYDGREAEEGTKETLDTGAFLQGDGIDDAYNLVGQRSSKQKRREGGDQRTDPEKMPAAPTPAMALPMMKAVEFGAAPQTADPSSKRTTLPSRTVLTG